MNPKTKHFENKKPRLYKVKVSKLAIEMIKALGKGLRVKVKIKLKRIKKKSLKMKLRKQLGVFFDDLNIHKY